MPKTTQVALLTILTFAGFIPMSVAVVPNRDIVPPAIGQCTNTVELSASVTTDTGPLAGVADGRGGNRGIFVILMMPPATTSWYYVMDGYTESGVCGSRPLVLPVETCDLAELVPKLLQLADDFKQGNVTAPDLPVKAVELTSPCIPE